MPAATRYQITEFKDGFAVIDTQGSNPVQSLGGEVLTRTNTKEQADAFVKGLQKG